MLDLTTFLSLKIKSNFSLISKIFCEKILERSGTVFSRSLTMRTEASLDSPMWVKLTPVLTSIYSPITSF